MGLYLCVFDGDEELDGVEVGIYADFGRFRSAVASHLEDDKTGARYPVLQLHSDCDGEWSVEQCGALEDELEDIARRLRKIAPAAFGSEWQEEVARSIGLTLTSLYDCFVDVDGEP